MRAINQCLRMRVRRVGDFVRLQVRLRGRELQRKGGEQVVVGGGESETSTYRDGMAINRHGWDTHKLSRGRRAVRLRHRRGLCLYPCFYRSRIVL